ncbi:MAG: hypothetical protein NW217_00780 [Hyphomicrobiaceae bacterium]|nr:hypothetical protein [Hyphomicrobiaceae bacterium]
MLKSIALTGIIGVGGLAAALAADNAAPVQQAPDERYVCVKKWGLGRNEGYCGFARQQAKGEVAIRIVRLDRTVWRTGGTPCSGGQNIKDLLPGVTIVVPDTCI